MAFHPIDQTTDFLLPPSMQEWLPEANPARYAVDWRTTLAGEQLKAWHHAAIRSGQVRSGQKVVPGELATQRLPVGVAY